MGPVITGYHSIIYSDDPEATRAFLRDVLGWGHIDAGGGWLIFKTPPSEVGVHPTKGPEGQTWAEVPHAQVSLMCDDLDATRISVDRLMGTKPEARFDFIQENAAFVTDLDI